MIRVPSSIYYSLRPIFYAWINDYIDTKDRNGNPNGFAALRQLGAKDGFHIDPCIAAPGAPKGVTDLLDICSHGSFE